MYGIGGGLIALIIIVIIALVIIVNCVKIVPQAHAYGCRASGRISGQPGRVGLHFKVPFIDQVSQNECC